MPTYQEYRGRFTLSTSQNDFTINDGGGADAVSLTTGSYYVVGYTSEATNQLIEHMQASIRAVTGYDESTVTYSSSTGLITLAFIDGGSPVTTAVVWTDSGLRDLLGFTANLSGDDTYTATYQPRYIWRPSRAAAEYPLQINRFWSPRSNSKTLRSSDGTAYGIGGNTAYEARIRYSLLPEADVIIPASGSVNKELQQFWLDCLSAPSPVRIFPDRTATASTDYVTALLATDDEEIGSFSSFVARHIESYNGYWDAELDFWRYTE